MCLCVCCSPRGQHVSAEVQCSLGCEAVDGPHTASLMGRASLTEELKRARQEIINLRHKLGALQVGVHEKLCRNMLPNDYVFSVDLDHPGGYLHVK